MAINSLGIFQFVTFTSSTGRNGAPLLPRMENEIIQRPGIHGSGIRRLGVKGMTFQMISTRDTVSVGTAASEHSQYTGLTNDVPQEIVFKGFHYAALGVVYAVLDVSDPDITPLRNKVGGILGSSAVAAKLTVTWTLQPVTSLQFGGQLQNGYG